MVENVQWEGSIVADGALSLPETFTVPNGELWLVGEYRGILLNDEDTATGSVRRLRLQIESSGAGGYAKKDQVIAQDSLSSTGTTDDFGEIGDVNWYAYPGETVLLQDSDPQDNTSEFGWVVTMRRID